MVSILIVVSITITFVVVIVIVIVIVVVILTVRCDTVQFGRATTRTTRTRGIASGERQATIFESIALKMTHALKSVFGWRAAGDSWQ